MPEKDADPRSLKLVICFTMPNFYGLSPPWSSALWAFLFLYLLLLSHSILCDIKLCMFKNFHLMPHWTCPLQTFAVDTAKSIFQPYSAATFLQLHIFSMENALNNDYFEELFPVSVWSLRPPPRYSIVWKLSLGNYLCYVKALDTRMQKFNSMLTLRTCVLITTSFTLVAALQLSPSVYVNGKSKFSFCKALKFSHTFWIFFA